MNLDTIFRIAGIGEREGKARVRHDQLLGVEVPERIQEQIRWRSEA